MRIAEENWKVLESLFPAGWQQMAWQSGAVERLRGFPLSDVSLRMLMLHVASHVSQSRIGNINGTYIFLRLTESHAGFRLR